MTGLSFAVTDGRQADNQVEDFAKRDKPGGVRAVSACDFSASGTRLKFGANSLRMVLMHELAQYKTRRPMGKSAADGFADCIFL